MVAWSQAGVAPLYRWGPVVNMWCAVIDRRRKELGRPETSDLKGARRQTLIRLMVNGLWGAIK